MMGDEGESYSGIEEAAAVRPHTEKHREATMPYTRREFLEASAALGAVLGVDLRHWNPGVINPWSHPVAQEPRQRPVSWWHTPRNCRASAD